MKYRVITRDHKSIYTDGDVKGMFLFGIEEEIETGQDCFAMVFSDEFKEGSETTPQDIYDIHEFFECGEDVLGYSWDDGLIVETPI